MTWSGFSQQTTACYVLGPSEGPSCLCSQQCFTILVQYYFFIAAVAKPLGEAELPAKRNTQTK